MPLPTAYRPLPTVHRCSLGQTEQTGGFSPLLLPPDGGKVERRPQVSKLRSSLLLYFLLSPALRPKAAVYRSIPHPWDRNGRGRPGRCRLLSFFYHREHREHREERDDRSPPRHEGTKEDRGLKTVDGRRRALSTAHGPPPSALSLLSFSLGVLGVLVVRLFPRIK